MHVMTTSNNGTEDQVRRTSVSMPFATSVELNQIKLEMSQRKGRMINLPDVITELIACWREHQP